MVMDGFHDNGWLSKQRMVSIIKSRDKYQDTNLLNHPPTQTDLLEISSSIMEYQNGIRCVDKEIAMNNFVNQSSLINQAKKKAKEADLYLKKLNEIVLPRCQVTDITSDTIKRDVNVPPKVTQNLQQDFKKTVNKNVFKNNEKTKEVKKPKSKFELKVRFEDSKKNVNIKNSFPHSNNSCKLSDLNKEYENNVGIVNLKAEDPDEKINNDDKMKNLKVQQIPRIDLKPDLVTQKLANIQIKPINKKYLRNNIPPNVNYRELEFELEPEICKCKSLEQSRIVKDKTGSRYEICTILYGMLNNVSSSDPSNDHLISKLQKLLNKLKDTKSFEYDKPSEINDLIEEHSLIGFSEMAIQKRLLKIAENLFENDNDEISFDQMSIEIENHSSQVLKRLTNIKNSILSMSPSLEFSDLPKDNELNKITKCTGNNSTYCYPNDNINLKDFHGTPLNKYVSVKEFLHQGSSYNLANSKMFKNPSIIEESDKFSTTDQMIQNLNTISNTKTQNIMNYENNTSQIKEQLQEFKNEDLSKVTLPTYNRSSKHVDKPLPNYSRIIQQNSTELSEEGYNNNNGTDNYLTFEDTRENDNSSKKNDKIKNICTKTNDEILLINCAQQTEFNDNENSLNVNASNRNVSINSEIQDSENCKPNIQEWISNSLSSNNNQQNLGIQTLDKEIDNSLTSTTSSMMSIKKYTQETGSDVESSISFGEFGHISGLHHAHSNSSIGEIKD